MADYGRTEFTTYTYAQLVAMLAAGRPADVRTAADGWRTLATDLDCAVLTLEEAYVDFQDRWQGPAAKAHARMVEALLEGLRQVAWTAKTIADRVAVAREALDRARDRLANLPPNDAIRAAAVLADLRDAYRGIEMPAIPAIADPPVPAPDGSPVFAARPVTGPPVLFPELWRDGLIAAAGAPAYRLLPAYAAPPPNPVRVPTPAPADPLPSRSIPDFPDPEPVRLPDPAAPQDDPARAVGHSSLAPRLDGAVGASTVAGVAGMAGAAGVMASAAGSAPFVGGFVPPMSPGMGGDLGRMDSRATPAWLVETLTVFDDATVEVVPGLVA